MSTSTNNVALVHVSTSVSKLGPSIPTVNLPAIVTCRKDAPCTKGCYACKGRWNYPNVKKSLTNNLKAYQENPKLFFDMIAESFNLFKYARFHSSGDIVDYEYLAGMCKVARKCKNTQILAFTKKFELVNQYISDGHRIPKNLHIVFSSWKGFVPSNPYKLPTAWVKFPGEKNYIPENALECSGKCDKCLTCFHLNKKQAVYFKKH